MPETTREEVLTYLEKASMPEISDLIKDIEVKFDVKAAAPVAVAGAPAGDVAAAQEEKTEFDVVIKSAGPKKIETIKVIRQLTSLGLVEAKNMAEAADSKVLTGVSKEAAEDAKKKLVEAGAEVVVA